MQQLKRWLQTFSARRSGDEQASRLKIVRQNRFHLSPKKKRFFVTLNTTNTKQVGKPDWHLHTRRWSHPNRNKFKSSEARLRDLAIWLTTLPISFSARKFLNRYKIPGKTHTLGLDVEVGGLDRNFDPFFRSVRWHPRYNSGVLLWGWDAARE